MGLIAMEEGAVDPSAERLHVLVLPYPAKGHSIPLLHLAKRLHSMDVIVTFVNPYNHLSKEHFRTLDGLDGNMRVVELGVPPPEGEGTGELPYVLHVNELLPDARLLMENLFAENKEAPPSCIVSDMFLGWTQIIADEFNIPRYVLFSSPASALPTMLHVPELIKQGRLPIDRSKELDLVHDIPGVPPTRLVDLPSPMQDATRFIYPFYVQNTYEMHDAAGVLINTYYELESSCIDILRQTVYGNINGKEPHLLSILPVGPLLPHYYVNGDTHEASAELKEQEPCLKWLGTQPKSSVLYVSFGSVATISIPQIHELALGLEASGERFLMALRPPPNPDNVPLLPEGFEGRVRGRGFVHFGWVPQLYVLAHQAVGGYLSHCGWNSSLEGLCQGLPVLAWPIQAEQAMNARFLVDDVKVALEVCTVTDGLVTKDRISKIVRSLMREPEGAVCRTNATELRNLAINAAGEGGSVSINLKNFLQELRSWKTTHQHQQKKNNPMPTF